MDQTTPPIPNTFSGKLLFEKTASKTIDCIEFLPNIGSKSQMLAASYQYNPETKDRTGSIELFHISNSKSEFNCKSSFYIDTPYGIFDIKPSKTKRDNIFAAATSKSSIEILSISNTLKTNQTFTLSEGNMTLSIDWNADSSQISGSFQNGSVAIFDITKKKLIYHFDSIHSDAAWITYFHPTCSQLFSGGDDCKLHCHDIKSNLKLFSKTFDGGVCSIQSSPFDSNLLSIGGYNQQLEIYDLRNPKVQLSSVKTNGGVWRIKWNPFKPHLIGTANMRDHAPIFSFDNLSLKRLYTWKNHEKQTSCESLLYGFEWGPVLSTNSQIVATGSFYNKKIQVWEFNSSFS